MLKKNRIIKFLVIFFAAITAITAFSAISAVSFSQTGIVAYAADISAPSVKASRASYNSVKLSWKKVSGAQKYIVMRSTKKNSGYKTVKTVTKATYTDKKLKCGKTYYYKVVAVKGSTKKTSKTVKIKCAPIKPTSVKATSNTCAKVKISYKKVSGASGYEIYYSSTKNGSYKKLADIKKKTYTHSFSAGSTGYYKVRAYRLVKGKKVYSAYSKKVSCTVKSHSYTAVTVAATCTSQGYTVYTCSDCGSSYISDYTSVADHTYGSYTVSVRPTCATEGSKYATCTVCGYVNTVTMEATGEHTYVYTVLSEATCTEDGSAAKVCSVCGKTKDETAIEAAGHSYTEVVTEPTDTEWGYTTYTCTVCGYSYVDDYTSPLIHTETTDYSVAVIADEDGTEYTHLYYTCAECGELVETDTCRIDMTDLTADDLASLSGVAKLSTSGYKLTLTATQYVDNFELSGEANNITVSLDAYDDADIKLNGLTITNDDELNIDDCIRINNKCTDTDDSGETVVPTVSVTANNATENYLTVTAEGGKAIQCETKLQLKGHGTLNTDTVSTSINPRAKLDIKNITLNIESGNRGIDTKLEITDEDGNVTDTEYSNIAFGANATVTINSEDDGIRCKNMEFEAIDTDSDTPSVLTITSANGDAIQLEGKKGLVMYQGYVTLTGGKSTLNNKSGLDPVLYNEDIGLTWLVEN